MQEKLSDSVERKYVNTIDIDEWEIETDTGWKDIKSVSQTVEYEVWEIHLDNGMNVKAADTHIFFDENMEEIFMKNCIPDVTKLHTKEGVSLVKSVVNLEYEEKLYDLEVDDDNHRFYTNGILSHNSITTVGFLLWYALFNADKTVAILANKGDTAREMLSRLMIALENVPFFLQPGCKEYNKSTITFDNNTKIIARATSASSIRGMSCVVGSTKICIEDDYENIFYTEIDKIINKSKFVKIKEEDLFFTVYQITNKVNNKIYVGYHQTSDIDDGYFGSGKLIKRAIAKYGIESFEKKILKIFDNKKEAELYEAQIVDKDFTLREDTYNINIGGNVRISYGKNNPFYGKKHSEETRKIISEKNTGNISTQATHISVNGKIVLGYDRALQELGIDEGVARNIIIRKCGDPEEKNVFFVDDKKQQAAEKHFLRKMLEAERRRQEMSKICYMRFKDKPKSEEHRRKISEGLKGIKRENPQNKDPEKIRKTAEKHRGMKRSDEAKEKMSLAKKGKSAKNKGKKYYRNVNTGEGNYFLPREVPDGWIQGTGKRK